MSSEKYPINLLIAIGKGVPEKITPDIRAGIEYAVSELSTVEQNIITVRFLEGRSQREAAEIFNLTTQCISEIEAEAINKLRQPSRYIYIEKGMHSYVMSVCANAYKNGYDTAQKHL